MKPSNNSTGVRHIFYRRKKRWNRPHHQHFLTVQMRRGGKELVKWFYIGTDNTYTDARYAKQMRLAKKQVQEWDDVSA